MSEEKKDDSNKAIYLPVSIIVATLILSGTLFITAGNVNSNIAGLAAAIQGISVESTGGNNDTAVAAPQPTPSPSPQQSRGTINMSALLEGAAASDGSPDAEIVIVEYSDYQCPFCRSWYTQSKSQLDSEYIETGKVRFVYKDFPLSFHPMAQPFAEAARCAGDQGKYWEMHDKIFEEQQKFGSGTVSQVTIDVVKSWAGELGLDSGELNSCIDSGKHTGDVQANFSEGAQLGVSGTPSFVIGKADGSGQIIVGAQPYAVFKSAIDSLLN